MSYRPDNWEELAKWTDPSGKGHPDRGYFEAGANAMLKAIQEEYGLTLFALDYNQMPVIIKDNQQVLVGIKLEEGELPVYLSAFTSRGDYTLRNLIITGRPIESDI